MEQKCENCKMSSKLVEPSIFKCNRNGKTVMFRDWCEYWEKNPYTNFKDSDILNFFDGIFNKTKEN